jgi:HSP90 family molecular chaperone
MKDWQKEIYFMANPSVSEIKDSQFMDRFNEKDVEVVFMVDPVDEYVTQQLRDFDGKKFQSITAENVELKDEDEDLAKRRNKAYTKKFKSLTKWLKNLYGASVMKVSISKRLGRAPAIMSSSTYGSSANMERIMRAQTFQTGGEMGFMNRAMRVFEINPRHPFILKLLDGMEPEKDEDDADIEDGEENEPFKVSDELVDAAWMLHDMALLNGGFYLEDTKGHTKRMTRVLKSQMGVDSLSLADEIDPPEEDDEAPEMDADGLGGLNMDDFGDLGGMGDLNLDDLDDM